MSDDENQINNNNNEEIDLGKDRDEMHHSDNEEPPIEAMTDEQKMLWDLKRQIDQLTQVVKKQQQQSGSGRGTPFSPSHSPSSILSTPRKTFSAENDSPSRLPVSKKISFDANSGLGSLQGMTHRTILN
jgi:hypothetical protein